MKILITRPFFRRRFFWGGSAFNSQIISHFNKERVSKIFLEREFNFFPSTGYHRCIQLGQWRRTRRLLACLYRRWWVQDGVHFVSCHLVWGDSADALWPVAWLWRRHVWAPLCSDYVGRARCLLICLWEGACLWIIALWEREKKKGEREGYEKHRKRRRRRSERQREREKPPWLWLWNGLSQIKATGMQAEMSQSLPQPHWLVRLLHWAYLRLYTPRIHRWMYGKRTRTRMHTRKQKLWGNGGRRGRQEKMRGWERLRTRGESMKTNMLQIGLQLREKGRKRKRGREKCAQGKTQENKREQGEREFQKAGSHERQGLK